MYLQHLFALEYIFGTDWQKRSSPHVEHSLRPLFRQTPVPANTCPILSGPYRYTHLHSFLLPFLPNTDTHRTSGFLQDMGLFNVPDVFTEMQPPRRRTFSLQSPLQKQVYIQLSMTLFRCHFLLNLLLKKFYDTTSALSSP